MSSSDAAIPSFIFRDFPILVRGGGDLGSGVAFRLTRAGFPVIVSEQAFPLAVRLGASFARAVWDDEVQVDGLTARRVGTIEGIQKSWAEGVLPVVVASEWDLWKGLDIAAVVDARMLKKAGTALGRRHLLHIGLGPGFRAGVDCDAVVETQRGHWLGRVHWRGGAADDSGLPNEVHGHQAERVVRAPAAGVLMSRAAIGAVVRPGDLLAEVGGVEVRAPIPGVVRGLIHEGAVVWPGLKIGDIDPRGVREYCFTISDKALAVGGGVLAAVLESPHFRKMAGPAAARELGR